MSENPPQKPEKVANKLLAWARKAIDKLEEAGQTPEPPRARSTADLPVEPAASPLSAAPLPPPPTPSRSSRLTLPGGPGAAEPAGPLPPIRRATDTGSLAEKAPTEPSPTTSAPLQATPAAPRSGPLPGLPASPRSGPLPGTPAAPRSGPLPARSAPLLAPQPIRDLQAAAEASERRMGVIVAYMKEPGHPDFQDKPTLYALVSEERSYQQALVAHYNAELKRLPPGELADLDDPAYVAREMRRGELEASIEQCKRRHAQLFSLLKGLTGVKGKTGGTGFLGNAEGGAAH